MTIFQSLFLGLIQGLTEFLPISSSGHLELFQKFLHLPNQLLSFDIVIHVGTLLAVMLFFRKELAEIVGKTIKAVITFDFKHIPPIVWQLIIGTLPALVFGILIKDFLETIFSTPLALASGFITTAILLFLTDRFSKTTSNLDKLTWKDSLIIDGFQAFAIIPSISRSGSTLFACINRGLDKKSAFTFSFLLSIPAVLGAQLLDLPQLFQIPVQDIPSYFLGLVVAAISGYIALSVFQKIVTQNKLAFFGYYCLALATLIILFLA